MRIRSIKPEFWRSRDIANLNWDARLVFIGLWSYVDDNGVGKDIDYDIIGDLFAADLVKDPRETVARVSRALASLSEAGLIYRYEFDGTPYLEIATWSRHQRIDKPGKSRYPSHEMAEPNDSNGSDPDSRDCRESVARPHRDFHARNRGTGEQGNRGTEDIYSSLSPQNPESEKNEKSADESASELENENASFEASRSSSRVEETSPVQKKPSAVSSKKRKVPKKEKKPASRQTALAPDWKPSPELRIATAKAGVNLIREVTLFVAYYTQEKPEYRSANWDITYRRWLERDIQNLKMGRDPNNIALHPENLPANGRLPKSVQNDMHNEELQERAAAWDEAHPREEEFDEL